MSGSIIKNMNDFQGGHKFLAEELMVPLANKVDVARLNLFTAHFSQTVILNEPEIPLTFSRFENLFGSYTTAIKSAPSDMEVLSIFEKNSMVRIYALKHSNGELDIHFANPTRHLTENYGYLLKNKIADKNVGDIIAAGSLIQSWPCHDDNGNFKYGRNFRTLYSNYKGLTYEDSIVCSVTASHQMSHSSVEVITATINSNDITVGSYSNPIDGHKGFPDVGEFVKDGILLTRRRINHDTLLYDMSDLMIDRVNSNSDTNIEATGMIVDIDIFSNQSAETLERHPYNAQILRYQRRWEAFREWVMETFGEAVENGGVYSQDVGFWYRRCKDSLTQKWIKDKTEFDGHVLQFTVVETHPAKRGTKITNRVGGKGVISKILPDHLMPRTKDGLTMDLAINGLGVINRLNPGQNYEGELNYIGTCVVKQMQEAFEVSKSWFDAYQILMKFYSMVSKEQHTYYDALAMEEIEPVVMEIINGEASIYIHQPPFFGNISLEELFETYKEFGAEKVEFEGMEEPCIPTINYYMKLRHEPSSKFSSRSAKHLSITGVPSKNSRGVRASTEHHSTTPIRLGEQELENLLVAQQPEQLNRFMNCYANSDTNREEVIVHMLTRNDPFSEEEIEVTPGQQSRPIAGLNALLETVGLEIVNGIGNESGLPISGTKTGNIPKTLDEQEGTESSD